MDQSALPLNFYCRNARLCLKKATFSKKSQLFHDELSHLRQFESLVGTTIPEHAQFEDRKTDKQIVELQIFLADARKRIQELEGDSNRSHILGNLKGSSSSKSDRSTPRSKSSTTRSPRLISLTEPSITTAVSQPSKSLKKSSRALPPTSKKVDLPQQKQQSWGVWTANPHDTTLSPPSKKHASGIHKSRKLADDLKSPSSSNRDASFMPVRSGSPDQRAEAILGGCALLATHLQSFEDAKDDVEVKREEFDPGFDSSRTGEQDKMSSSWLLNYPKSRDRMDYAEAPNVKDDAKSSDKATIGGRRFRFATHYFEKKLQEKMNRLQQQCPNTAEDVCGSSPTKVRTSAEKVHEEAYQEQGSSEESLPGLGNLHTAFSSLRRHPETTHLSLSSSKDKLQPILREEDDVSPAGNDQLDAGADDIWARKLVPAMEQKLTSEMLRAHTPPRHSSNSSSRKKHKKKGILCVMDDAIRQAVDSDSDGTNASYPKDNAMEVATKSTHGSQQRDNKRRAEDVPWHNPPAFQGLQVEALEKKITSLQSLVGDLKTSVEGFTSRVEEEVGTWQCRVQGVEMQMLNWRDNAEKELMGMKGSIEIEVQMKLEELTKGLGKAERLLAEAESRKEISKQRMESSLEDCCTRVDSLKRQVDSLVADVKLTMNRDMRERVSQSVQDMSIGVKGDLDLLELGMSKDLESLRKDLEVKFDALRAESEKARRADMQQMESLLEEKINRRLSPRMDMASGGKEKAIAELKNELRAESERLRRAERQQIETLIEERIERRLSQPLEIVSGGKEKVMADMKTELRLLWTEVDLLIKGREEIKDNMEQLNQIAEKAKEAISKEQDLLKTENGSLKKQLQYFKKESMQTRIDAEDFKKDIELEVEDIRTNIRRLKDEGEDVKQSIECLKKARDDHARENKSLRKLIEGMREESAVRKVEAEAFRKGKEEFEMIRGSAKDGSRDRTLIMERVEKLSQVYLGGLDEVRRDIMSMKIACGDRLEELERQWGELKQQQESNAESEESLRELVLDGLETRIAHLERLLELKKETFDEEQSKVQSTIAIIDKDREHAASALAQVAAASQKAEELISETLGTFHSEMTNMKRQSMMIQEKLLSEKDAAEAALSEVLRMRDHVGKETETTFSLISDAKSKTLELQEGLEREREGLRGSIMMAEKDREAALAAASEAAAAADQAGKALGEICEVRRKSVSFSEHLTEVFGETHMKYTKELEGHIEAWNRSMEDEMLKAKSHVQGIEEEKRKSLHHIEGWRQVMLDEVSKAKTVVEGIEDEKRKSVCIIEATAFQERHDFEEHKRTTETTIQDLAKSIKEMSDSLDSMMQRQAHAEQEDEHLRRDIDDIGGKMKEALARLDKISMESSQIAQEMQSSQAHGESEAQKRSETLQQEIGALERIVKETAAETSAVVEKVQKVERAHKDLLRSVEEIQANTGELEKAGAMWLQKYDAASRILQEIEKRLSGLENAALEDDPAQQLNNVIKGHHIAPSEKQRLIRLYRELSGFLRKMKTSDGGKTDDKNAEDCFGDEWSNTFNEKLAALETWVKNVESDAFPKLKVLESKTEELSVGMQTALEGASLAESKCSALGAELVKVFRMLASSRKESPTKMMMMGDGDEDSEQHQHQHRARCIRSHHKSKALSSHAACTYCKRAAMKGANDLVDSMKEHQDVGHMQSNPMDSSLLEGEKTGYYYESSKMDNMSPCMDRSYKECGPHGKPHLEQHPMSLKQENQDVNHGRAYHGGEDLSLEKSGKRHGGQLHRKGELMEKLEDYEALEHLLGKKNNSDLKAFEGKLPITHEKVEDKRLDGAKKDTTHTTGKNCQSTNIRLEAGKIQVNVSHRSAVLSGSRLTKRGDAISVRP